MIETEDPTYMTKMIFKYLNLNSIWNSEMKVNCEAYMPLISPFLQYFLLRE